MSRHVHGIAVPVDHLLQPVVVGSEGIGIAMDDQGCIVVVVGHADGTVLLATLGEEDVSRFAHHLAELIEQGNADLRGGIQ